MDFLSRVMCERRRAAEAAARRRGVCETLEKLAARRRTRRSLRDSIARGAGTRIIAEVKKASPSAGVIVARYSPAAIAADYAQAGAAGISVLTEPLHFKGSLRHLEAVRAEVDVPVLRKDFICHPHQMLEAAALGADAVLLIAAALSNADLASLYAEARRSRLDVLLELHDVSELDTARLCPDAIVGVNSRNLKTLKTDLAVALDMRKRLPRGRVTIAESGIRTRADIEMLQDAGYDGFLVGESLLRTPEPGEALKELLCESK